MRVRIVWVANGLQLVDVGTWSRMGRAPADVLIVANTSDLPVPDAGTTWW